MRERIWFGAAIGLLAAGAWAQEVQERVTVNVWKPEIVAATPERVDQLRVPTGFRIAVFAENLGHPRMLAVGPEGSVYVSRNAEGDILRLEDRDNDGRVDTRDTALTMKDVHGLCVHENRLYFTTVDKVYVADISTGGALGPSRIILSDMPDGGQHARRTIAVGPDKRLYISIGSTCNACNESNPEHATIIRCATDGSGRETFATGLRNSLAFGWHPRTGAMYGVDQGIDDLGDESQAEELNLLVEGKHYGWPHVYEDGKFNPVPPLLPGMTREGLLARNTPPVLTFDAHASPIAIAFVGDSRPAPRQGGARVIAPWPDEYRDDALVTFRGSWNRRPPSGYLLAWLRFSDGKPAGFEPFISGFLIQGGRECFGRIAGLAWARDGSLLMSEDTNGVIYRIWPDAGNDQENSISDAGDR